MSDTVQPFPDQELHTLAADRDLTTAQVTEQFASWLRVAAQVTRHSRDWTSMQFPSIDEDAPVEPAWARPTDLLERYDDLGPLGLGGMGEVRQVYDRHLNRTLAMKTIRAELVATGDSLKRFIEEAQIAAQLQHPGIVAVHDFGLLPDGRAWFTMDEIRGRTLHQVMVEARSEEPGDWTLRRLIEVLRRVCEAMAYAHSKGVIHRDLKPANIMLGLHGDVLVLDWGLAKVLDHEPEPSVLDPSETPVRTVRSEDDTSQTHIGRIAGTPAYMPPEQAQGDTAAIDERADVYALGAILCEVLTGHPPIREKATDRLRAALSQTPSKGTDPIPLPLAQLATRCLAMDPELRPFNAGELTVEIQAWLEGARQRARALREVQRALTHDAEAKRLKLDSRRHAQRASDLLHGIEPWQPEHLKQPAWVERDAAAELHRKASLAELAADQGLHAALRIDPDLPEAHACLAERFAQRHADAEDRQDRDRSACMELLLRAHTTALPPEHARRSQYLSYLDGTGALSLVTDPPGAEVALFRFEDRHGRLIEVPQGTLGTTPLSQVPLPMGSYLCVIRHPDRAEVRYRYTSAGATTGTACPQASRRPIPSTCPCQTNSTQTTAMCPPAGSPRAVTNRPRTPCRQRYFGAAPPCSRGTR